MSFRASNGLPLPIRPASFDDELLSTWIVRLAHAQGNKVESVSARLFGRGHSIWCRDIDARPPDGLVEVLSAATGQTAERIESLSFRPLKPSLGAVLPEGSVDVPWLLKQGTYHRARRRGSLMYCAHCLRDGVPYFRKMWRLAFVTCCVRHGTQLSDACPHCQMPLAPHRVDRHKSGVAPSEHALAVCWNCAEPLAATRHAPASDTLLGFTGQLMAALSQGFTHRGSNPSLYSPLFFDGLRCLARTLHGQGDVTIAGVDARIETMEKVAHALDGDCDHLVRELQRNGVRYHRLFVAHRPPYWLESEVSTLERSQAPAYNLQQLAAAASVLEVLTGKFRASALRTAFGIDSSHRGLPSEFSSSVSDYAFEALIMFVEAGVNSSSVQMTRLGHKGYPLVGVNSSSVQMTRLGHKGYPLVLFCRNLTEARAAMCAELFSMFR